jgi:hypothetical protein
MGYIMAQVIYFRKGVAILFYLCFNTTIPHRAGNEMVVSCMDERRGKQDTQSMQSKMGVESASPLDSSTSTEE